MSNTNDPTIIFTIPATDENQEIITNVTALLYGGKPAMETPEKPVNKKPAATEPDDTPETTLAQFKAAAKKAKTDHDEDFAMETLTANGVDVAATLGRSLSKVDPDDYATIMEAWLAGPKAEPEADDDLDDDLNDDDAEVTAEAVKVALKAYSKNEGRDEAREIMAGYKCKSLGDVDKLKPAQLAKLMEEIV